VVVKVPVALALILAGHLAVATTAAAQIPDEEPLPTPIPPRI
jgi:hypothetical protein